jgi:hypothetical protein
MAREWMNEQIYVRCIRIKVECFSSNQKYKKWRYILWMQRQRQNWIKSIHKSLTMLPVIILNIFFCILKIFALCEEFHQNFNPQFITEWT